MKTRVRTVWAFFAKNTLTVKNPEPTGGWDDSGDAVIVGGCFCIIRSRLRRVASVNWAEMAIRCFRGWVYRVREGGMRRDRGRDLPIRCAG